MSETSVIIARLEIKEAQLKDRDQTIARLEAEIDDALKYQVGLKKELAASREKLECGHPKMFKGKEQVFVESRTIIPGHCTICAELAASRVDVIRLESEIADICPEGLSLRSCVDILTARIAERDQRIEEMELQYRKVLDVTTSDAAAREEWIRRIRLEEHYTWPDPPINSTDWIDWARHCRELSKRDSARVAELRAPVPAARAEDDPSADVGLIGNSAVDAEFCRHKEINNEGICKSCGAKAAIWLPISKDDSGCLVDMSRIQDEVKTGKEEIAVCLLCKGVGILYGATDPCPDCHGTGKRESK